ncbi:MAG: hypothetical protein A2X59_12425 [Nitrospirae bacterium GWC2_42_7]|nr:MAG: hypothetical protein A2X59_12425 [Nitrospirae bacterium GWC2_42_7]
MKKIAQMLMTCFMAAGFMVITFALATAADRQMAPSMAPATQMQKQGTVKIPMMCPPGWHQKKSNTEEFKCAPNKPAPMKCPEGWQYAEALDCQGAMGLGTQTMCTGCEVGCNKIPVIK